MEKEIIYSFWERLKSDTPTFFKRAQLFGVGLVTLGTSLTQINGIPATVTTIMMSVGGALAAIAQFAVKQCEPVADDKSDAPAEDKK